MRSPSLCKGQEGDEESTLGGGEELQVLDQEVLDDLDEVCAFGDQVADDREDEQSGLDPLFGGLLVEELAALELEQHGVPVRDLAGTGALDRVTHDRDSEQGHLREGAVDVVAEGLEKLRGSGFGGF